jgi:hypothetical protein
MNSKGSWSRKLRKIAPLAVLIAATIVMAGLVYAAPILIDNFDDGDYYGQTGTAIGSTATDYGPCTGCIGGERDLWAKKLNAVRRVSIESDNGTNQGAFNQDTGALGVGEFVWDGADGDPLTLDRSGLGSVEITDGGTNDGIQLLIYQCDGAFELGIHVYNATEHAYYTITVSTDVFPPGQSFFIPVADFAGQQSVFTDVGAIKFRIAPTADSVDLALDLLEATAQTDWGDLPENGTSYPTTAANNGPRHVRGSLYLGANIDQEADGLPDATANGDNNNNLNDEQGIVRKSSEAWGDGDTVHIFATVTGGTGDLYAWFDWDNDGDLSDETVYVWEDLTPGMNELDLLVDDRFDQGDLYARFRLVPADDPAPDYTGEVDNGEVEDYYWDTTPPTAVSLAAFDAAAAGSSVQLTWETASELDNLGFNLYRATSLAGVRSRLNTSLIASQAPGSAAGAAYSFADEAVNAGATYYYWLEAVDVNGGTSLQGPVSAQASYLRRFLPARPRVEPLPTILRSR